MTTPSKPNLRSKKPKKSFEQILWDSARQLRGNIESAEYKYLILSLVFLKFISHQFETCQQQLTNDGKVPVTDTAQFYKQNHALYLPENTRWSYLKARAKQDDIATLIDTALSTIKKHNPDLKEALPNNLFTQHNLMVKKLATLMDTIDSIDTIADEQHTTANDIVGRVYEYFLGKFAAAEGKGGGEFYTPKSVVTLLVEMLEPYSGKVYDPCCGSGGMFIQSLKFVRQHKIQTENISIYGQELTPTTYKLAKMNLSIRGLSGDLGQHPADTFFHDQHKNLKADFIMANPPFNLKDWRNNNELTDDPRFNGFRVPPTANANYGWILHILSKLSTTGTASIVLANGSMSSNTLGEGEIRQQLIESDLVECIIALPDRLFYTTQIPVCLWFITKDKTANPSKGYRDRQQQTLFIDARKMGAMISRIHKELTVNDIALITDTFHAWRNTPEQWVNKLEAREINGSNKSVDNSEESSHQMNTYEDKAGFCKSSTIDDISKNDFILSPGLYVGSPETKDDYIPFEVKMSELSQTLYSQMRESDELDKIIRHHLKTLGFGE